MLRVVQAFHVRTFPRCAPLCAPLAHRLRKHAARGVHADGRGRLSRPSRRACPPRTARLLATAPMQITLIFIFIVIFIIIIIILLLML